MIITLPKSKTTSHYDVRVWNMLLDINTELKNL